MAWVTWGSKQERIDSEWTESMKGSSMGGASVWVLNPCMDTLGVLSLTGCATQAALLY